MSDPKALSQAVSAPSAYDLFVPAEGPAQVEAAATSRADAATGRDLSLDVLRGYLMFAIVVNHLNCFPSLFGPLTGRGAMWASAAEGFMAISGFLVGRVRGPLVRDGNVWLATKKLWERAFVLILWSIMLSLIFTVLAHVVARAPHVSLGPHPGPAWRLLWDALRLRYSYGYHDMLSLYGIYLAISPLALALLARGHGWAVALISAGTWAYGFLQPTPVRWSGSYFSEPSWQLLFFGGLVMGYYTPWLSAFWRSQPEGRRRFSAWGWSALAVATMIINYQRLGPAAPVSLAASHVETSAQLWLSKVTLGPARIGFALLWLVFLYALIRWREPAIRTTVGRALIPLGQNSLYVYILQAFAAFFISTRASNHLGMATAIDVAVLVLLWWMVKQRVLFNVIPR